MSKPAYPRITFETGIQLILNPFVPAIENVNMLVVIIPDKFLYEVPHQGGADLPNLGKESDDTPLVVATFHCKTE